MKNPLSTYLHDHLAGATFAVEILEALRDQHSGEALGELAQSLLVEIEADRTVLKNLADQVAGGSNSLKEAVSWIAEKASRLKLRRETHSSLGTFESVETLALGILGKEALWKTLAMAAEHDPRLQSLDFATLVARARDQHAKVELHRVGLARTVFRPVD